MSFEMILANGNIELPSRINNFDELKAEISARIEFYKTVIVTEETIAKGKADKAALNKLKKSIDDERIRIKKLYLMPYEELEKQCKELSSLIAEGIAPIDEQLKAFDEKYKAEKWQKLEEAYAEIISKKTTQLDWLKLEDIVNPKWANKTSKLESLIDELNQRTGKILADMIFLESKYKSASYLVSVIEKFKETGGDLSKTLVYESQLETAEKMRKQEEERQAELESQKISAPEAAPVPEIEAESESIEQPTIQAEEPQQTEVKMVRGTFRVECTREQLIELVNYMKNNGIKYASVK